jgi:hypothetical protein
VESITAKGMREDARKAHANLVATALRRPLTRLEQAGWASEAQFHEFRRVRVRG